MFDTIAPPKEKLSQESIIDEAETHENENGAIAFAKGVRWAIKLMLPFMQDYHRNSVNRLLGK